MKTRIIIFGIVGLLTASYLAMFGSAPERITVDVQTLESDASIWIAEGDEGEEFSRVTAGKQSLPKGPVAYRLAMADGRVKTGIILVQREEKILLK